MKLEIEKFFKHPFFTTVSYISQWVVLAGWSAYAIHTAKDCTYGENMSRYMVIQPFLINRSARRPGIRIGYQ